MRATPVWPKISSPTSSLMSQAAGMPRAVRTPVTTRSATRWPPRNEQPSTATQRLWDRGVPRTTRRRRHRVEVQDPEPNGRRRVLHQRPLQCRRGGGNRHLPQWRRRGDQSSSQTRRHGLLQGCLRHLRAAPAPSASARTKRRSPAPGRARSIPPGARTTEARAPRLSASWPTSCAAAMAGDEPGYADGYESTPISLSLQRQRTWRAWPRSRFARSPGKGGRWPDETGCCPIVCRDRSSDRLRHYDSAFLPALGTLTRSPEGSLNRGRPPKERIEPLFDTNHLEGLDDVGGGRLWHLRRRRTWAPGPRARSGRPVLQLVVAGSRDAEGQAGLGHIARSLGWSNTAMRRW
jgi:hypothetical protein